MAGTVIQKAIIEVKYDDFGKAQLAMKAAGVEMVNFGEQAKKAKGKTGGLTSSIGDLSEKLDKRLEHSLGRAFKSTDRLQSILGQAGTVGAVFTTVAAGLAAGLVLLSSDALEADRALGKATAGIIASGNAADAAAQSLKDLKDGWDKLGTTRSADQLLKIARARAVQAAEEERLTVAMTKVITLEDRLADAARATAEKGGKSSDRRNAQLAKFRMELAKARGEVAAVTAGLSKSMQGVKDAMADPFAGIKGKLDTFKNQAKGAFAQIEQDVTPYADKIWERLTRPNKRRVGKAASDEAVNIFETAADEIVYQWGLLPSRIDVALSDWEPLTAWANSLKPAVADLADAMDQELGGVFLGFAAEMDAAAKATEPFQNTLQKLEATLEASGEATAAAAFDALVYGESFSSIVNDYAESQAKMAAIGAAMETAKGLGAMFLNPAMAEGHFMSAAAYAGAAAIAGGVAMATGGFDGSGGGGGGDGGGGSTDPAVAQSRTGRPAPDEGSTQPIIVFEGAVYDTEGAAARAFGAVSANAINASSNSRGAPRVRQAAIRRGRR